MVYRGDSAERTRRAEIWLGLGRKRRKDLVLTPNLAMRLTPASESAQVGIARCLFLASSGVSLDRLLHRMAIVPERPLA